MLSVLKAMRHKGGPLRAIIDQVNSIESGLGTVSAKVDGTKFFISPQRTGTGEEEEITHPLGAVPSAVLIALTSVESGGATATQGTHTSTKIRVTVTSGAKYQVIALKLPT